MNQAITYYLTILRDKETSRPTFREAAHRLSDLLAHEVAAQIKTEAVTVQTPLAPAEGLIYSGSIVVVPILRSGIAMLPSFLRYFPMASIGVVGLKRDEKTAIAHRYYSNMPPIDTQTQIIIIDPMLATGGTAVETIKLLREHGARDEQILFVSIVSAPEGMQVVQKVSPELRIITVACDERLNDKKFIVPGIGDFGDRYFGTLG